MHETGTAEVVRHDLPAGHVEQAVEPANEYCSSVAPLQTIGLTEVVKHLKPAGHYMQVCPPEREYVPERQLTGAFATPLHEEPAGQVEQAVWLANEYYSAVCPLQTTGLREFERHLEPAGHSVHCILPPSEYYPDVQAVITDPEH